VGAVDLAEEVSHVQPAMRGTEPSKASRGLRELALARDRAARHRCVVPGDCDVDEPLEEVALVGRRRTPRVLERLVCREVLPLVDQREAALVLRGGGIAHRRATLANADFKRPPWYAQAAVATILVAGIDLFFRGKLDALLGAKHKLVTTDSVDTPELVIVDIARVDPDEVAEEYPDIPILGFTNHTDTAGLRAGQAAGFDRVVVRSALAERASEIVDELVA
jgi:hypothetical protein